MLPGLIPQFPALGAPVPSRYYRNSRYIDSGDVVFLLAVFDAHLGVDREPATTKPFAFDTDLEDLRVGRRLGIQDLAVHGRVDDRR